MEAPREERVKIVEEFWSKYYKQMNCPPREAYPRGGLLRQMAFGCFLQLFKMVDIWGYKLDFTIVEDDGMNILDWINYVTTTPSNKLLHPNDTVSEERKPCMETFKAKIKPTGYNPVKQ